MKSVTITIPEELDAEAAAEARRRGISKSELIRLGLRTMLPTPESQSDSDPWQLLSGFGSAEVTVAPGDIDEIVYGR